MSCHATQQQLSLAETELFTENLAKSNLFWLLFIYFLFRLILFFESLMKKCYESFVGNKDKTPDKKRRGRGELG